MKKLRIHYFQHVPYEGLGYIEEWISTSGHLLSATKFYEKSSFPAPDEFDFLIIMGGSMSVNDEHRYSWLAEEKAFIRKAIDAGKTVLGICLGSQLVSSALGAKVYRNKEKEIGWFDIELTANNTETDLFPGFERKTRVFHWHGDTFDIPDGAVHLASSDCCKNQAYVYNKKVLALQFHLEPTPDLLSQMLDHGRSDLTKGSYVQTEEEILSRTSLIEDNRKLLFELLDKLTEQ
jgi:GMP synthase-like glutamine amidotransferase